MTRCSRFCLLTAAWSARLLALGVIIVAVGEIANAVACLIEERNREGSC